MTMVVPNIAADLVVQGRAGDRRHLHGNRSISCDLCLVGGVLMEPSIETSKRGGFSLWVYGRQFPDANDYWDRNWLNVVLLRCSVRLRLLFRVNGYEGCSTRTSPVPQITDDFVSHASRQRWPGTDIRLLLGHQKAKPAHAPLARDY
jgi:hypothetical protein